MNDIVREFLLETHENLAQLDLDLITLEKDPRERETLARVFRTLHTIKGTAGFLGLVKLQALGHAGENLLSRLRDEELAFNPEIATALLAVVDAIRKILAVVEATEQEGDEDYSPLIRTLEKLTSGGSGSQKRTGAFQPAPARPHLPSTAQHVTIVPPPAPAPSPSLAPARHVVSPTVGVTAAQPAIAAAEAPPAEPAETRTPAVADSSVRVDVGLLDKLMTLVGELVLARNQIVQYSATQEDTPFVGTVQRLNLLTTELQAGVMKTRMQPIGNVWGKFPRIVRDLAVACVKQVRFDMEGQDTELDRTIIEAIRDPLTHMVRNAVDHGIEAPAERAARGKPPEGRLILSASHEGGKVVIKISDDGGGIDPIRVRDKAVQTGLISSEQAARMSERELINLVFLPGFSTANRVTHFSGRGVGMDVVRTNIEKISGTVDIESRLGFGTTVRMIIPLTLAIIPALTITAGGDRYAIPQVNLLELLRVESDQVGKGVEQFHGVPVYRLRGSLLPLVYLGHELQIESGTRTDRVQNVVVLQADDRAFGLVVDDIHDTEEIVVKPLQKQLKGIGVFAGAMIMGDGRVALILDVLGLAQRSGVLSAGRERARGEAAAPAAEQTADRQTVLLIAAGGGRMAIPLAQVARLEEFPRAALERVGSRDVVQYRGEILPLVHVARTLRRHERRDAQSRGRPAKRAPQGEDEKIQVVVHAAEGRRVGLVVGRIIDIVEETIASRAPGSRPGVMFSAVVQERVTEFLDVPGIVRSADPWCLAGAASRAGD